ncbi:MAG TPA: patatin-like phospholipase family protein [Bryobacteraceae bacterium]|nr:patatin-like phospholipase family protein [Bryobacteraceae bacterium]
MGKEEFTLSSRIRSATFLLGTLLLVPLQARPQDAAQPPPRRPRIGLALAGGSAYGLAHVGVLKWLHEHRIPVDAVAGTSMGGLVGGLFATGHSPSQIEDFVSAIDWNQALQSSPPFAQLSFRRKEDQRAYPGTIELGYRRGRGLSFPSAFSSGHGVSLLVSRFAAPYGDMDSFSDLPADFRCVSVDLVKAKTIVFSKGSLPQALRATMSIPGVFAPIEQDGMLLVDGGLLNNLPVDVARQMNPDLVIAVALDPPPPDINQIKGIFGVARRTLSVMIADNERRNLGLADLVIMPDLKGLTAGDFPNYVEFIRRGYQAAEAKRLLLEKLSVSPAEYARYLDSRDARRRTEQIRPLDVVIEGKLAPLRRLALLKEVAADPTQSVDRFKLEEELTKIVGAGRFDSASYTLFSRDGHEGIKLAFREKDHGPPFVKPSFLLMASPDEGLRFGAGARVTFLDAGGPASEWRTDLSIGVYNRLGTEYYYRLKGGKWFLAPSLGYEESEQPLYQDSRRVSEFTNRRIGGAFDLGYAFGRFQELRMGWTLSRERILVASGPAFGSTVKGRASTIRFKYSYEGQDAPNVPTHGLRINLQGHYGLDWPGVKEKFGLADALVSYARPLPNRFILIGQSRGGFTRDHANLSNSFELGGPLRMSSLARSQSLGSRYYYGGASLLRGVSNPSLSIFGRFYALLAYEAGAAWSATHVPLPRHSATAGLMGETQFGVVLFGVAYGDRGEGKVIFRLGRFF